MSKSLEEILKDSTTWGRQTFPDATPFSCAAHLYKEAKELKQAPTDPGEIADIVMLAAHCAFLSGIDLAKAIADKLEIVKEREWGEPDEDGVIEHIKKNNT